MVRELKEAQFPPTWAGYLNHGYGYPLLLFTYPLTNFSKGTSYVWDNIMIYLTYNSNWKKALKIVEKEMQNYYDKNIKKGVKNKFENYSSFKNPEKVVLRFGMYEKGLYIKARYLVDFNKANEVKREITEMLLDKLKIKDISLGKTESIS